MREIKFRAWDSERKMFVPQGEIIFKDYGETRWKVIPNCLEYVGDQCHNGEPQRARFTIEQYTGLKDKNGVDIYEGDVLVSDFYPFKDEGMNNYIGVVTWIFSSWQIVLKCVNPLKSGISNGINHELSEYFDGSEILNFEILGNIHSNPELLK